MEDDDFGDFAGFASSDSVNKEQNSFSNDKPTNNGFPNFSSFDVDLGSDKFCIAGGVPFEIPSLPSSPTGTDPEGSTNIHTADGVSFDIPPLPDFSSLDMPIEDLGLPGNSRSLSTALPPQNGEKRPGAVEDSYGSILVSGPVQSSESSVLSTTVISFPTKSDDNEFGGFAAFSVAPIGTGGMLPPKLDDKFSIGPITSSGNAVHSANTTNSLSTSSLKPSQNGNSASTNQPSFMEEEFGDFSAGFGATTSEPAVPISSDVGPNEEKSFKSEHVADDKNKLETVSATLDIDIAISNTKNVLSSKDNAAGSTMASSGDFGGFEAFSTPAPSSAADGQFGSFAVNFPSTSASSSNPEGGVPLQVNFADFSSFPASTHSEEASGLSNFGNFSSFEATVTSVSSSSNTEGEKIADAGGNAADSTGAVNAVTKGVDSKAEFGNFGSFSGTSAASTTITQAKTSEDDFGDFGSFSGSSSVTKPKDSKEGEFGDFGSFSGTSAASTTVTQAKTSEDDFGDFGSFSGSSAVTKPKDSKEGEFGDFGSFSKPLATGTAVAEPKDSENEFGDFGSFSGPSSTSTAVTKPNDSENKFGDFGSFSDPSSTSTAVTKPNDSENEFGDFGSFSGPSTTRTKVTDENEEFGEFGNFTGPPTATTESASSKGLNTVSADDFGEFGVFSTASNSAPSNTTSAPSLRSGQLSGQSETNTEVTSRGDDDFGEFGAFSSTPGAPSGFKPSGALPKSSDSSKQIPEQQVGKVFQSCFGNGARRTFVKEQHVPLQSLNKILRDQPSEQQAETLKSVWLILQGCIDLTVPLHKFDRSCLQDNYYSTLNVNPKLESRPTTLSVLTGMAKFEDPLGGTTAMEDLRESFGFEGDLPELGSPTSPTGKTAGGFRRDSVERGPALLDLSLPLSPQQKEEASFTLTADLADLDLNPSSKQHKAKQLTSIEQLLLNERLVVNRSTWVDSQLADLGDGKGSPTSGDDKTAQPDTPRGSKKTVELQLQELGLDVSKTTLPKGKPGELSLSARTLLGRLPDLSFMLLTDKVEDKTNYARGYS